MSGAAIGWKFNHAQGICTRNGEITAWPDEAAFIAAGSTYEPQPNAARVAEIVGEYAAFVEAYSYRVKRGEAYKQELGDTPGFDAAIADVLDAVIDATDAVLTSTGTPVPAKFAEKKAKRDEIKLRHPKP